MHFVQQGSGTPPFVFVHGFTCDLTDWDAQVAAFTPRHQVVACDLRGHGGTPGVPDDCSIDTYGADVAALLEQLDLRRAILVGHSLGCRVVLRAAGAVPDRVAGVVLIDGSQLGSGDPEAAERATRAKVEAVGFPNFVQGMFEQMFVPGTPESIRSRIVSRAMRMPAALGTALFPRSPAWDARHLAPVLEATSQPLLVLQSTAVIDGRRVSLAPGMRVPYLDLVRRAAPHASIETIPATGHFMQIDAPDWVNAKLAAFAAKVG